jgi:hypothetical protein
MSACTKWPLANSMTGSRPAAIISGQPIPQRAGPSCADLRDLLAFDLSADLEKRYHRCWFEILEKE